MSHKREREADATSPNKMAPGNKKAQPQSQPEQEEELVFEDQYEDEYDSEDLEFVRQAGKITLNEEGNQEEQEEQEGGDEAEGKLQIAELKNEDEEEEEEEKKVWNPHAEPLEPGEKLEYDSSAYDMIHFLSVEWPCLSFDVISDNLGFKRTKFPHTMYLVAGTQAPEDDKNYIMLMKLSELCSTKNDDEDSDGGFDPNEASTEEDTDPILETRTIPHSYGSINRIRSMPQQPHIVSCFSSSQNVLIYDFNQHCLSLDKPIPSLLKEPKPVYTFPGHTDEGWAVSWSPKIAGRMATGDCKGNIHIWEPNNIEWQVEKTPHAGHQGSVEDICWSPSEAEVFSSCGVDGTIKLWDLRKGKAPVTQIKAHSTDVNVMGWNHKRAFLLLSGADDGNFRVWDLRKLGKEMTHQFSFSWHRGPITSVEWNPNDDSELIVSSADNTITIWDLSLTAEKTKVDGMEVPSQLLFVHQGQTDIKEVHWHKQIPGTVISTAIDGFNVFKPNNLGQ